MLIGPPPKFHGTRDILPSMGGPTAGAARLRVQLGDGSGTPTAEAHQKGAAVSTTNGIAKLWKPVVNVCDLSEGERFWSALTGLSPTGRHGDENGDQYSSLDDLDGGEDTPWLLLQLVPRDQVSWIGGTHLDLRVDDVALAVRRAEAIGGSTVKPPAFYPSHDAPYLEWAIMQDPFGNQFCFVKWPLASPPSSVVASVAHPARPA